MSAPLYHTADTVRALPVDGNRYETVYGELLMTPAPQAWHQEVLVRLLEALRPYVRSEGVGHVLISPADISWSDDTLVQPDLLVVDLDEARTLDWARMKTLLLVVEILSPTTARYDRFTKRRLYQAVGVPTYWIVDPEGQQIEVWSPHQALPNLERQQVVWQPEGAGSGFVVQLDELFRPL